MADFSVAAVISNHCVLQRDKNISIFGRGQTSSLVKAELKNSNNQIISSNSSKIYNERWVVELPPVSAQENCTLTVTCNSESRVFTDISIGEVWLAGGQSNMEFELQNCTEAPSELTPDSKDPNVRFYYTNKIGWMDEKFYEAEKNTSWQTWDSEFKKSWSAVGYFYAKKLAAELGVTVGVIGCNWGGTSASAWMSKEALAVDTELKTYLDEYEEATKGKSIEQQCKEYDDYELENAEWQKKSAELYSTVPGIEWAEVEQRLGKCPWPGPKSCKNPYRPAGLYECMLQRIIPYTLKGFIWYQGESDDHKPGMYYKLFSRMIQQWRDQWKDDTLPFLFVQLPTNRYKMDKDFKHWCFVREAQAKVSHTINNTYMTCAMDLGEYNDIHPKHKKVLAERMAANALINVYKKELDENPMAPEVISSIVQGNTITIKFSNAEDGFTVKEDEKGMENYKLMEDIQKTPVPEDFTGFEIAGIDGVYYPAEFAFGGTDGNLNTISLCSKKVPEPVFARYAWFNYGPVTIFSKSGVPVAPFRTRTDDVQTATEHADIQQIMTV